MVFRSQRRELLPLRAGALELGEAGPAPDGPGLRLRRGAAAPQQAQQARGGLGRRGPFGAPGPGPIFLLLLFCGFCFLLVWFCLWGRVKDGWGQAL